MSEVFGGEIFRGSFTQQEPIPEDGIAAALAVLRHGRLHRYNTAPGEIAETALLEEEFAAHVGAKYCLAVASGGYALGCALRALDLAPGEPVLTNAFTLAPVPGAIAAAGGRPVFVEITEALVIDFADLEAKARASGARLFLLSHMRGHLADMSALMRLCDDLGLVVIEDCAHTMGAAWAGLASGRFGRVACYSMQTYKHMNAGEGGFLTSDDPHLMARAVLLSGSYMLYTKHRAAPPPEAFEEVKLVTPNVSGRMDNLRAAILRPQVRLLAERVERWGVRYRRLESGLRDTPGVWLIRLDLPGVANVLDASGTGGLPMDLNVFDRLCSLATGSVWDAAVLWFGLSKGRSMPPRRSWIGRNTPVQTARGLVTAEALRAGDHVLLLDHGFRPLEQIGRIEVPSRGSYAPVLLRTPFFGATRDLLISADQMVLVGGASVEYVCGVEEVLIRSGVMVNGRTAMLENRRASTVGITLDFAMPVLLAVDGVALLIPTATGSRKLPRRVLADYEAHPLLPIIGAGSVRVAG